MNYKSHKITNLKVILTWRKIFLKTLLSMGTKMNTIISVGAIWHLTSVLFNYRGQILSRESLEKKRIYFSNAAEFDEVYPFIVRLTNP